MIKAKVHLHSGGTEGDDGVRVTLRWNLRTGRTHFKHVWLLCGFTTRARLDAERYVARHLCATNKRHYMITTLKVMKDIIIYM